MKKIFFLCALICAFSINSFAQVSDSMANVYKSQVDTMKIAFTAPVGTEMYVAHYMEDPGIPLQIALATQGVTLTDSILNDDTYKAAIVIRGALVVRCFEVLRNVPEGLGADENKKLLTALMPVIMQSPALSYVVNSLKTNNQKTVLEIKRAGAGKIKELQKLLD